MEDHINDQSNPKAFFKKKKNPFGLLQALVQSCIMFFCFLGVVFSFFFVLVVRCFCCCFFFFPNCYITATFFTATIILFYCLVNGPPKT